MECLYPAKYTRNGVPISKSVTLGTSPIPLTSKNKSGLVKIPVHFNVY